MTAGPPQVLRRRDLAVVLVGVGYAGAAALTPPLTEAAAVAVAVPSLALLVLAGLGRRPPRTAASAPRVRRTALAWGTLLLLAAGWDLAAWLQQPAHDVASHEHPTVSLLLDPVTGPLPWRFVAWCCWLYVGYRLVRRWPCAP